MAEENTTGQHEPGDPHLNRDADGVLVTGLRRYTYSVQGSWDKLISQFKSFKQGVIPEKLEDPLSNIKDLSGKVVASARISRRDGNLADMTVTFLDTVNVKYWSLDWVPVSKDIHTWNADAKNDKDRPDLSQIIRWEQTGASGDMESYNNFLPGLGEDEMTGNTLKLAEKIKKGVQSYTIHAPVITITVIKSDLYDYLAAGPRIDVVTSPDKVGYSLTGEDAGNFPVLQATSLKDKWMLTSHRITGNPDGTFTCVQQWTGMDDVDPDLYESEIVEGSDG